MMQKIHPSLHDFHVENNLRLADILLNVEAWPPTTGQMTAQRRTRRVDVPLAYNTKETTSLLSKTTQPPVDSIHRTWTPPPHSLPCQRLKSSILNHNDTVIEVFQLFSLIRRPITTFRFVMVGFIVFCTNHKLLLHLQPSAHLFYSRVPETHLTPTIYLQNQSQ